MREELRTAFGTIRAEEGLKQSTRTFLQNELSGAQARAQRAKRARPLPALAALACALLLFAGGGWLYFAPTATVSIDVNPSIELGINRFDRVVSATAYNQDGEELLEGMDLLHMECAQAVETVLQSDAVASLIDSGGVAEIGVIGPKGAQCDRLLTTVESCAAQAGGAHCYQARAEEVAAAHELGLSYGKYRAYLQLAALDPTATPEQVQGMSMRELRQRIAALLGEEDGQGGGSGQGGRGHGNGWGHGSGQGHGQGGQGHGWGRGGRS